MALLNASAYKPNLESGINTEGALTSNPQYGLLTRVQPATANINNAADNKNNAINIVSPNANDGGAGLVPQQVGTMTSGMATAQANDVQNAINAAKQTINQGEQTIQDYDIAGNERQKQALQLRMREQAAQDKEDLASSKAGQFKLGQAGTGYAEEATRKIKETQSRQNEIMQLQFQDLVDQAGKYMIGGDVRKASQLMQDAKEIQNQQYQMRQEQRQQESADLDRALKISQEQRAQGTYDNTFQEKLFADIAPNIFKDLEADPSLNYEDVLGEYAERYGVDPVRLSGQIIKYQQEAQKDQALASKANIDLLTSLSSATGETFTTDLPGVGKVTIKPKGDFQIVQQAGGRLSVFDKNTGKVTNAVVRASDLTPNNISGLISEISKPVVKLGADGKPVGSLGTFDEYLKGLQDKAGMSFGQDLKAKAKEVYDARVAQNQTPVGEKDISHYSVPVQNIINGLATVEDIKGSFGTSVEEKKAYRKIQNEVSQAKAEGLIESDLSEAQNKFITTLNDSVSKNATYTRTISMQQFSNNVLTALSNKTGPGDIAAINQYQKVIDEGAVTRDQDVQLLVSKGQSLLNRAKSKTEQLEKGEILSPDLRLEMQQVMEDLFASQVQALKKDPYILSKSKEAERHRVKLENTILGELSNFETQ